MNEKPEAIQWVVEFTIEKEKLEEFKRYATEMVQLVERTESSTGIYKDSQAGLAHMTGEAVRTIFPKILNVAKITRFEIFGNPSKEILDQLSDFKPKSYGYLTGFTR
jgi:quinol monooxygenase YgiN